MNHGGRLTAYLATSPAREAEARDAMLAELERFRTEPPSEGAVPAAELQRYAVAAGLPAFVHHRAGDALDAALADRREGEIVLVAGSLFLVAAVREYLRQKETGLP